MNNMSVSNILNFVQIVQDSCDKHRTCLKQRWQNEFAAYLAERKKKQSDMKSQVDIKKVDKCTPSDKIVEEIDELNLADSILKKARNIRCKNEKNINGIVDLMSFSHFEHPTSHISRSNIAEKTQTNKKILQSKSDFIATNYSCNIIMPRSKSASLSSVPKKDTLKSTFKCPARPSSTNRIKPIKKTSKNIAVISHKDLSELNNLCNLKENKQNEILQVSVPFLSFICVSPRLDLPREIQVHQAQERPTLVNFTGVIKRRFESPTFVHKRINLWYPFLSFKNEIFLTTTVKCHNFSSFKKTCNVLNKIQEILIWIDLLYLVDEDIIPGIIYDDKDVNSLRICSYILSMFHHHSQRLPILNPKQ